MYLYYVTAAEPSKGRKPENLDLHAILARDYEHLKEKCARQFSRYYYPVAQHKLNKDWK